MMNNENIGRLANMIASRCKVWYNATPLDTRQEFQLKRCIGMKLLENTTHVILGDDSEVNLADADADDFVCLQFPLLPVMRG